MERSSRVSSLPLCFGAGDVLFQMAEVHRQIQVQLEEMVGIPAPSPHLWHGFFLIQQKSGCLKFTVPHSLFLFS